MWIRRSACVLAICLAQTMFAQAADTYEVYIKNDGVDGDVEVKCDACDPKEIRAKAAMKAGAEEKKTVYGSPKKDLTWTHTWKDGQKEKTKTQTAPYGAGDTVVILSAE